MIVTVAEARKRFKELLVQAALGQVIVVTRYGKPVAVIAPPKN